MWLQTRCVYALWPFGFGLADLVIIIMLAQISYPSWVDRVHLLCSDFPFPILILPSLIFAFDTFMPCKACANMTRLGRPPGKSRHSQSRVQITRKTLNPRSSWNAHAIPSLASGTHGKIVFLKQCLADLRRAVCTQHMTKWCSARTKAPLVPPVLQGRLTQQSSPYCAKRLKTCVCDCPNPRCVFATTSDNNRS